MRFLPREHTLFVSANGWDAEGAKRNGLTVAWIDRGTPPPGIAPDLPPALAGRAGGGDLAGAGRQGGERNGAGSEHRADAGDVAVRGHHPRPRRREKIWAGTVTIHPTPRRARTTTDRSNR